MVIKGNARGGAKSLADHVQRVDTNERVEILEISGTASQTVLGALREMEAVSLCTNTRKPFYHASINTRPDERLTPKERLFAIDALAQALGFEGQPRVVIVHEKLGREHCHIIWSRADVAHSRAIRMDHNYRTHEIVARNLERAFGHARVQGAHIEREGTMRPARTFGHDELQQASHTGLDPKRARDGLTALWRSTDSGRAFHAAVEEQGWVLARGDRRDFVLLDPHCGVHSLGRRIEGSRAADVRLRMQDVDASLLPSVQEARQLIRSRMPPGDRARSGAAQAGERKGRGQASGDWIHETAKRAGQDDAPHDGKRSAKRPAKGGYPEPNVSDEARASTASGEGQRRRSGSAKRSGTSDPLKPDKEVDPDR